MNVKAYTSTMCRTLSNTHSFVFTTCKALRAFSVNMLTIEKKHNIDKVKIIYQPVFIMKALINIIFQRM